MAKKRKYKVHWSLREKIITILSIVSFLLVIAGIIEKKWSSSESEPIAKPSKVKQTENKNW